jgi:glyoxylase-like metal-dependent hydrolase (beta-lactamase superfamily II)
MMGFSRRSFVVSSAAASAALGLNGTLEFIPPAFAEATAAATKGFYKFKLGDAEVITVYDGVWEKPHDAGLIKNASIEETKAALKAAGYSGENVPIPFTVTFLKRGDKVIMFDSGTGGQVQPTAGQMIENMAAAGIDPKSITTIIVSHLHPDHIFGLMAKDTNAQIYPNAEIIVPNAEMAFWTAEDVFTKLPEGFHFLAKRIQATLPAWKNVTLFDGEKEVAPGIVAIQSYGHSPGHTVYAVGSGKEQLLVVADIANMPALFVKNPQWHFQFDADPNAAEASRRRIFDRAIAENAIVSGYHFGIPGAGSIQKDGNGYAFVPIG